jgi:hypothetical protein
MYVVDLIDKNYNECKDWIAVFNDCKECSKTKMRDWKKIDDLETQMKRIDDTRIQTENKKK